MSQLRQYRRLLVSVTDIQLDFIDLALAVNPPPTVNPVA
ncbi:hypothetical protein MC7420_1634 [Coleofasciculus chthonoplastes PCC 7420]|uniref:Uncharacterized protein n=1 Tax=Coleofasciculus chthonoplastes PCC 7420 TaxID=118168 RepID=B4W355_9CYAN|nr:hypothetical protein MC7420_1634 [Coleofasciculus chthonoplastes PCC 7420]